VDLELLINNAGFGSSRRFHEADLKGQEAMVRVHILATMALTYAAIPNMIRRGSGAIINVSSLAGFAPLPGNATYSGTKAFLSAFSEALSLELARTGVKVQALCPRFHQDGVPLPAGVRYSQLEEQRPDPLDDGRRGGHGLAGLPRQRPSDLHPRLGETKPCSTS
jgi:NAD(P)-dependent dehydrogenase (short-subunit alcohol dehydrogenase family)